MGDVTRGRTFILQYPVSMTYRMPSTVSEVSAMLVETMHLRVPSGAGSKILACRRGHAVRTVLDLQPQSHGQRAGADRCAMRSCKALGNLSKAEFWCACHASGAIPPCRLCLDASKHWGVGCDTVLKLNGEACSLDANLNASIAWQCRRFLNVAPQHLLLGKPHLACSGICPLWYAATHM